MTIHEILNLVTPVVSAAVVVATFMIGRFTAKQSEGQAAGMLASDLGYIKAGLDDIKRKQEQQEANHVEMMTRLATVEASAKQAHHRIDKHDKEIEAIREQI